MSNRSATCVIRHESGLDSMKMRRPRSAINPTIPPGRPVDVRPPRRELAIGAWYAAALAILLLIAAGAYIVYLHQQRLQWQEAARQLSIGQDLLRTNRDELLKTIRDREAELAALEQGLSQSEARITTLEGQRGDLQREVVGLTQARDAAARPAQDGEQVDDRQGPRRSLTRERDTLARAADRQKAVIEQQAAEIGRLTASLTEKDQALYRSKVNARDHEALAAEVRIEKAAQEKSIAHLEDRVANLQRTMRIRQIVRGHRATFGEVKPHLAEVGAEDWQAIEGWLEQQLKRPMPLPNLASHDWSYEGARLLVAAEGPPMAMLLYADSNERLVSFTITFEPKGPPDAVGGQGLLERREGGLNLLEWREERHAFVLAGEADMVVLRRLASTLKDLPAEAISQADVPTSRYIRPKLRPESL